MDADPTAASFQAGRGAVIRSVVYFDGQFYAIVYEDPAAERVARMLNVFELDGADPGPHAWIVSAPVGSGLSTWIFADAGEADL